MNIAIIQPGFIPWLGFFEQMAVADRFVYLDDVQYTRKDWRNRNQLKSNDGAKTVSVPVRKGSGRGMIIREARINDDHPWRSKLVAQIRQWYRHARYFDEVFPIVDDLLGRQYDYLVDLNYAMDAAIASLLSITTPTFLSSAIPDKSTEKNQKVLDICRYHGADVLYDGQSARDFLDLDLFAKNGIQVVFQEYRCCPYPQLWGDFVSHLSALDLLLNCGPASRQLLLSCPLGDILTTRKAMA